MTFREQTLAIPPLYSPFSATIHPRHDRIQARSAEWSEQWCIGSADLRAKLVQHDIGTFAARVLPEGDEEVAQILAEFIVWLFGVDDGMCEEGAIGHHPGGLSASLSRLLRIAQEPRAAILPGDPLAEGLRDLSGRLAKHATSAQLARWVTGIREYFLSLVWEAHHRSQGTMPSLNDYALIRLYNGAASAAEPFLEIGNGYELTSAERHHPAIRILIEMAFFIIGWDNDIFSFHKESRGSSFYLNAVRVVQATARVPLAEALRQVIAQRDRTMCHFLRVRDRCTADLTLRQHKYLKDLESFIRGNQDWGISSARYLNPADPANLPARFTSDPIDDKAEPLGLPTLDSWWQL
jgi:hypothetical protein